MLRVLVVDDDYSMRLVARLYFQRCPLEVETDEASSGEEAIALLDQRDYDCVLTDHRMAAVTGLEVLLHAKEHQPDAFRFMMTGYGDPELMAAAKEDAEVHGFIEKPIGVAATHDAFRRTIEPFLRQVAGEPEREVGPGR